MPLEPTSYAVPQNPNAALMDYRIQGPMAGLMVGEQEAALDRAKQQQQIQNNNANAINDILVSQAQKDVPLNDLTRENKIAEQQFTKTNQQQIDESKVLEMMAKKSANERQMASDRAEAYVAVGQSMPDATDEGPAARAKYQALRASQSPEIQAKLPPEWSPQTHAYISGLMGQSKVIMTANAKIAEEAPKLQNAKEIATAHDETLRQNAELLSGTRGTDDAKTILDTRKATQGGVPQSPDDVTRTLNAITTLVADKVKVKGIDEEAKTKKSEYALLSTADREKKALSLGLPKTAEPSDMASKWREDKLSATAAEVYADQFPKAIIELPDGKRVKANTPEGRTVVGKLAVNSSVSALTGVQPSGTQQPAAGMVLVQIGNKTYQVKPEDVASVQAKYASKGVKVGTSTQPATPASQQQSSAPSQPALTSEQQAMADALTKQNVQENAADTMMPPTPAAASAPAPSRPRGQTGQSEGLTKYIMQGLEELIKKEAEKQKQKYPG